MNIEAQHLPLQRTDAGMTFGVLLPHFGQHASQARLRNAARLIEDLGFDAAWARDHLLWHPHAHESAVDSTFIEQFTTLATIGALTDRIYVGTAVMIPIRTPAQVALQLSSLSFLTGGRVIAGIGAGHVQSELKAANLDPTRRKRAVIEMIDIVRRLWCEDDVHYDGEVYTLADASLRPRPVAPIPIVYGGPSNAAVRLAAEHADGWLAGTVPFHTVDARLATFGQLSGRRRWLGAVPRTIIGTDRRAVREGLDIEAMSHDGKRNWETPASGSFSTLDDIYGAVIAGEPMDIVEGILQYAERGFDHFSFDLRNHFDRFEDVLELVADKVLPEARRATARAAAPTSKEVDHG